MSTEKQKPEGAEPAAGEAAKGAPAAAPAAAGPPALVLGGVAAAALVLGLGAGWFVLAPIMGPRAPKTAAHAANAGGEEKGGHGKDEKGAREKAAVFRLENVIVNPAGSQGTRFLMTTVAFEVADAKIEDQLRSHEIEIRDAVVDALEHQTLEQLTKVGARDSLKRVLASVVIPVIGPDNVVHVYLPQFVIQ